MTIRILTRHLNFKLPYFKTNHRVLRVNASKTPFLSTETKVTPLNVLITFEFVMKKIVLRIFSFIYKNKKNKNNLGTSSVCAYFKTIKNKSVCAVQSVTELNNNLKQ